jgi:sugar (pentulose or hexulose) kinase
MSRLVVGVDVGTTAVKVAVSVDGGLSVPTAHRAVPWTTTATGAQIDPELLFQVTLTAVGDACAQHQGSVVEAIAVASFAESVVLLDDAGRPIMPLVAWHDTRGGPEAEHLGRHVGHDAFSARTGLPVSGLCSAAKVRSAVTDGLDLSRVTAVLSATDWIAHRLGGVLGFDLSLASRTGWLELADRTWAPDLVAWTGLPAAAMPEVVPSGSTRGRVTASDDVPDVCHGALVVAAGMDHLVAAVGAGASSAGDVWDSCGTAEALVRSTEPLEPATVLAAVRRGLDVGWHADSGHFSVLGAQRSGYAFQRVLTLLGIGSAEQLHRFEASTTRPHVDDAPVFEDLYSGSYSLLGLTSRTGPAELWSALVERVAADGAALVRETDAVAGPHSRVVMGGGWSDSEWFAESKRRHLARLERAAVPQPGAEGAVLLARRALAG